MNCVFAIYLYWISTANIVILLVNKKEKEKEEKNEMECSYLYVFIVLTTNSIVGNINFSLQFFPSYLTQAHKHAAIQTHIYSHLSLIRVFVFKAN